MSFSHKPDWLRAWLPPGDAAMEWAAAHANRANELGFRIVPTGARVKIEISSQCGMEHLLFVRETGLHVSRFDIALDIRDNIDFDVAKKILGKSGRWSTAAGGGRVETLYSGKRSSARFFRLYDKAAEQGVAPPWWRVELEAKNRAAGAYFDAYLDDAVQVVDDVLRRVSAAAWANTPPPSGWMIFVPRPSSADPFQSVGRYRKIITACLNLDRPRLLSMMEAWQK